MKPIEAITKRIYALCEEKNLSPTAKVFLIEEIKNTVFPSFYKTEYRAFQKRHWHGR